VLVVNPKTRRKGTNPKNGKQNGVANDMLSMAVPPSTLVATVGGPRPFSVRNSSGSPAAGNTAPAQRQTGGKEKNRLTPRGTTSGIGK
jgi:hypothetical protein